MGSAEDERLKRKLLIKGQAFIPAVILSLLSAVVCPLFPETIIIVHSNDTHGIYKPYRAMTDKGERLVGGMEAVSHYLNQIRAVEKNVFVVETGDILTGTLAADIEYKGVVGGVMVEFLNRLGYSVFGYGNHDFDRGTRTTLGLAELARFPTIMANIVHKKNGKLFAPEPYHVFDVGKVKVAVIAVMEEIFLVEVQKSLIIGLDVLPVVPTLKSYVPELDKKSDLIVVIVHSSFMDGVRVAREVPGIDVVLVAAEDGKFEVVDGVLVQSTIGHHRTVGYLKVDVVKDRVVSHEEKLIWLLADGDLKPSPEVTALVKEVDTSIGDEYKKVIGKAAKNMKHQSDAVENELGNWMTDAMRWKTGADIAFQNSGGIRTDIKAGPITKGRIFEVSPFHNTLIVFKLTGQQVKDALEFDVERSRDRLQVSGLKYRYYANHVKPFGQRIEYIEVGSEVLVKEGEVLKPKKTYKAVSNNYLVGQAKEKYFGFSLADSKDTGLPVQQVLIDWLEKFRVLDYKIEKRIVEIAR